MIIDSKEYEITDKYNIENYNNNKLNIKFNNVTDMSYMFSRCSSLSSLSDISKWNTKNFTNISGIFDNSLNLMIIKYHILVNQADAIIKKSLSPPNSQKIHFY